MITAIAQISEYAYIHVAVDDDGSVTPLWTTLRVVPSPKVEAMIHRAIHGRTAVTTDAGPG